MSLQTIATRKTRDLTIKLFLLGVLVGFPPTSQAQSNRVESKKLPHASLKQVNYLGFASYRMSDGRSEAVIVPALGRVMRFSLIGGDNLLWNSIPSAPKPGEWQNWGGDKSWPAPQSQWPVSIGRDWPPHPSWDGEAHRATVLSNGRLRLTSGVWPHFGCRVIRDLYFEADGDFVISQTYEKLSGPPVEIALWNITQLATPEAVFASANPESAYKNGFYWLTKPEKPADVALILPDLLRIRPSGSSTNKIGLDAPRSSIASVINGLAFLQRAAKPVGNYPDGAQGSGFPLEIFDIGGTGAGHYLETELLSPLRLFYAGTRWTHSVRWSLHTLNNKDADSAEAIAEIAGLLQRS